MFDLIRELKRARVSVNLVQVFFWYKFLACNSTQLYCSTETVQHVTRTVQPDWPASCCCARNCHELASDFFVQVSRACVAGFGVPRRQSHRRSGLANLPSVGAVP